MLLLGGVAWYYGYKEILSLTELLVHQQKKFVDKVLSPPSSKILLEIYDCSISYIVTRYSSVIIYINHIFNWRNSPEFEIFVRLM